MNELISQLDDSRAAGNSTLSRPEKLFAEAYDSTVNLTKPKSDEDCSNVTNCGRPVLPVVDVVDDMTSAQTQIRDTAPEKNNPNGPTPMTGPQRDRHAAEQATDVEEMLKAAFRCGDTTLDLQFGKDMRVDVSEVPDADGKYYVHVYAKDENGKEYVAFRGIYNSNTGEMEKEKLPNGEDADWFTDEWMKPEHHQSIGNGQEHEQTHGQTQGKKQGPQAPNPESERRPEQQQDLIRPREQQRQHGQRQPGPRE